MNNIQLCKSFYFFECNFKRYHHTDNSNGTACHHIGYIKTVLPDFAPEYAFVQEYECKYKNPKLTLYRLCDGTTEVVKVKRKKYDESPIKVGDIIKTIECSDEGKWSLDSNGDWQQDKSDKETILKKWSFVRDENKEIKHG